MKVKLSQGYNNQDSFLMFQHPLCCYEGQYLSFLLASAMQARTFRTNLFFYNFYPPEIIFENLGPKYQYSRVLVLYLT